MPENLQKPPSNATRGLIDNVVQIAWASKYWITLGFAILLHILFLVRTVSRFPNIAKHLRNRGLFALFFHIGVSMMELLRWNYTRITTRAEPVADIIDIILCVAQVTSTMMIIRRLQKGHPDMVRPIFQAVMPYRLPLTAAAYIFENSVLHRASVMTNRGFLYVRIGIFSFSKFDQLKGSNASIYTLGSYLGSTLSTLDNDMPLGWAMFGYCVLMTSKLSRWTTHQVMPRSEVPNKMSAMRSQLVRLLLWIGLADLKIVKAYDDGSLFGPNAGEKEHAN
ncbi:hypothetical protein FP744_10005282 [Trichoderma asperellum]|nr:hypothetical protein LI328DRAFT_164792 [Trichoderma asperelloides]